MSCLPIAEMNPFKNKYGMYRKKLAGIHSALLAVINSLDNFITIGQGLNSNTTDLQEFPCVLKGFEREPFA